MGVINVVSYLGVTIVASYLLSSKTSYSQSV